MKTRVYCIKTRVYCIKTSVYEKKCSKDFKPRVHPSRRENAYPTGEFLGGVPDEGTSFYPLIYSIILYPN